MDSTIDLAKISKEIRAIEIENKRLQSMKGRYVEYAASLREIGEKLMSLAAEIDPAVGIKKKYKRRAAEFRKYAEELIEKMQRGAQFYRTNIAATYKLSNDEVNSVIAIIKKLSVRIMQRKDGRKIIYYLGDSNVQ